MLMRIFGVVLVGFFFFHPMWFLYALAVWGATILIVGLLAAIMND